MRANTSNWGIEHVPNDTWVDELSLHKYKVIFDYEQHQQDLLALDHALHDRVMLESRLKQVARNKRHQGFVDGLQRVKQTDRLTTQSIFNVFAEPVKLRKDQERQAMELVNTHKRERFRGELDKLCICTTLPFDCSNYEDLEDIAQLREIVAQKRRRA